MALVRQILLAAVCITSIYCVPLVPGRFFNFLTRPLQALQKPPAILGGIQPLGILTQPVSGVLSTLGLGSRFNAEPIPGLISVNGAQDSFGLNELLEALGFNNGISTLQDGYHLAKPINALIEGEENNGGYEVTESPEYETTDETHTDENNDQVNNFTPTEQLTDTTEKPNELLIENENKPDEVLGVNSETDNPIQKPFEEDIVQPDDSQNESNSTNESEASKESNEKVESELNPAENTGENNKDDVKLEEKPVELVDINEIKLEGSSKERKEKDKLKPAGTASDEYHTAEQPY